MVSGLNLPPQKCQNINFGRKSESKQPEQKADVIDQAYKITNDIPDEQKFFSPGVDLATPVIFGLPYALKRTDHRLNKLLKKLNAAQAKGNAKKIEKLTQEDNTTRELIGNGKVNIKSVHGAKEAFNEYGGKLMVAYYLWQEGSEVVKTYKELGPKAAVKQAFRGIANTAGSLFGWVAGSALAHKVGAKIGGAIGGAIGGPVGRFIGNFAGSFIGFLGGMLGERAMNRGGAKLYGKSEREQALQAKYKQDLKNIDLNDKTTLKQQLVKNQLWLSQFADENGNINVAFKKDKEKVETVMAAYEEMLKKFKAAGGTDEELKAAMNNPEETFAEKSRLNNENTQMYYSGAFNSATAKGDPRFNGYTQRVFA